MKDVCSTFSQITNDIYLTSFKKVKSLATQSCLTLHDPMDYRLPGSSVHGIFQARVPEWGAQMMEFTECLDCFLNKKILED